MNREHVANAILVGRLGQKPELAETEEGVKFVRLNVATSERYTDREGKIRETTEWTRAIAWGDQAAQIARDFDKGAAVSLAGSLRVNSYARDGAKNRVLELHVESAAPSLDPNVSRNQAQLLGVVRNIEKKTIANGDLTVVSLATTTVQNGKNREDWHSVTMWGKTAAVAAKEIGIGDTVSVNGSLQHRSVEGPGGVERRLSAVKCERFQVLERAQERTLTPSGPEKGGVDRETVASGSPSRTSDSRRNKSVDRGM